MVRVLVVEDDVAQRYLIEVMLSREGYEMVGVGSGSEAMALLARDADFDVIMCDFRMPGMDGLEFLKEVGRTHAHIPVIFMTVHANDVWSDEAAELGAAATLAKPFFGPELIDTIRSVLANQTQVC